MVEKKTEDKENTSSYEITTNLIFCRLEIIVKHYSICTYNKMKT